MEDIQNLKLRIENLETQVLGSNLKSPTDHKWLRVFAISCVVLLGTFLISLAIDSKFLAKNISSRKTHRTTKVTTLSFDSNTLDQLDLSKHDLFITPEMMFYKYFKKASGKEHYRLLTYLSYQFNGEIFYDIGTAGGASALALSSNEKNSVKSYDIVNKRSRNLSKKKNISFYIENISGNIEAKKQLLDSALVFVDTMHDGLFEQELYEFLRDNQYRGLYLLDDIHLNPKMRSFWSNISSKKYDLTKYGHLVGTGLVLFDDSISINLK